MGLILPQSRRLSRRQALAQRQASGCGHRFGGETVTRVPAEARIRPLRDQLIIEPLDVVHSLTILIVDRSKPLRGIVKAAGPGCYPKRYDHAEKHKRTKTWDSKRFQPTEVKVGDVVELGGAEIGGYAFETFYWGERLHLWCREADVAGVLDISADEARAQVRRAA